MRRLILALSLALGVLAWAAPSAGAALAPSTVGEPPNGGGVFRFPQAVAFSPGGSRVFVGDQYSGVISAFAADGTFQFSFGTRAVRRERGRLGVVGGVATDRSGHLYVLDSENDRVQVFSADDGRPLSAFGDATLFDLASGTPNVNGGISASGIAVTQSDPSAPPVVYVADQGKDQVDRFVLSPSALTPTSQTTRADLGLNHPQGIALDPAATRVYVADDDNHRVLVLDPTSLAPIGQAGSAGTGQGQFQNPYDVAVDSHNQLYVADNLNNRVDVFDATSLASLGTFGGFGRAVGQFAIVRAVGALADDPRGGVEVADTANNRIQALDPNGNLLAAWGLAGRGPGYFTRPRGVTFDPAGGIAVADTFDHRIERFDADGTYSGQFGLISPSTGFATQGSAAGQYSVPSGVAYDSAGNVWIADTGNDRVVELDPADGHVVTTVTGIAAPRGGATGPAGSVYVADTGNGRVVQILPGGSVVVVRGGLSNPAAVAWDGAATVYAADDTHVVDATTGTQIPAPGGGAWDHPDGLAFDPHTNALYVAERRPATANGARVVHGVRGGGGAFTWDTVATEGGGDGQVIEPANLALSPDGGTLLVADSANNRIVRLDAPGHAPPVTYALTVSLSEMTRGSVTSAPPGISCATDCIQHYGAGRQVTLSAAPFSGSVFSGWSGACAPAGATPTCTVSMAEAQAAGAGFAPAPPPAPAAPAPAPPPPPAVRIASLRLSTHHLRRARRGHRATRARVSLTLSQPATITLTVAAGRPGRRHGSACVAFRNRRLRANCTRFVALAGRRTLRLLSGKSAFTLTTLWNGRSLRPGSYQLGVIALDAQGNRVGPVTARFTVAR